MEEWLDMIEEMKKTYGWSESFYEWMVYVFFFSACLWRFPVNFIKQHLLWDFLNLSKDKVPAIKIIFFDAILGLKDCCVLDYDTFEEVNNTMAIMWEDSNEDYWARAESVAYEIHQWKKINPNEEHKSEQMSREEHEWCLQEKEEKEIEK